MSSDFSVFGSNFRRGAGVTEKAKEFMTQYPYVMPALLALAVIVIIYLIATRPAEKESFNPTQTMRRQQQDQVGVGSSLGGVESLSQPMGFIPNTSSDPTTAGYAVLHDPGYDCEKRKLQPDDAWAWQTAVAQGEGYSNPKTDRDFSKILTGR